MRLKQAFSFSIKKASVNKAGRVCNGGSIKRSKAGVVLGSQGLIKVQLTEQSVEMECSHHFSPSVLFQIGTICKVLFRYTLVC